MFKLYSKALLGTLTHCLSCPEGHHWRPHHLGLRSEHSLWASLSSGVTHIRIEALIVAANQQQEKKGGGGLQSPYRLWARWNGCITDASGTPSHLRSP